MSCLLASSLMACSLINELSIEKDIYPVESVIQKDMTNFEEKMILEVGGIYPIIVVKALPIGKKQYNGELVHYIEYTISEEGKPPFSISEEYYRLEPFRYLGGTNLNKDHNYISNIKVLNHAVLPKMAQVGSVGDFYEYVYYNPNNEINFRAIVRWSLTKIDKHTANLCRDSEIYYPNANEAERDSNCSIINKKGDIIYRRWHYSIDTENEMIYKSK